MSWLARSIAATLSSPRGEPDPDADEPDHAGDRASSPEGSSPRDPDSDEAEQPDTPSRRGVKDDISELTETLTRRLWGVASFLAPPPPPESSTPRGEEEEEGRDGEEESAQSPRIAGIRSDLAEIGGRVRSVISMLQSNKAVAEISKIASSLLPFGQGDADEGEPVAGVTEEVVVFVRHISTRPETWLDFPLFISERYADGKFHCLGDVSDLLCVIWCIRDGMLVLSGLNSSEFGCDLWEDNSLELGNQETLCC